MNKKIKNRKVISCSARAPMSPFSVSMMKSRRIVKFTLRKVWRSGKNVTRTAPNRVLFKHLTMRRNKRSGRLYQVRMRLKRVPVNTALNLGFVTRRKLSGQLSNSISRKIVHYGAS